MLFVLDLLSTVCFAFVGASIALRMQMNVFGILLSAMLQATGGGTVRELLLGSETLFWIESPIYVLAIFAAILLAVMFMRVPRQSNWLGRLFDCAGTVVFVMVGVLAALDASSHLLIVVIMGMVTGIGGGIIRQLIFSSPSKLLDRSQLINVTVSSLLCTALVVLGWNLLVCLALVLLTHFVLAEHHVKSIENSKRNQSIDEKRSIALRYGLMVIR